MSTGSVCSLDRDRVFGTWIGNQSMVTVLSKERQSHAYWEGRIGEDLEPTGREMRVQIRERSYAPGMDREAIQSGQPRLTESQKATFELYLFSGDGNRVQDRMICPLGIKRSDLTGEHALGKAYARKWLLAKRFGREQGAESETLRPRLRKTGSECFTELAESFGVNKKKTLFH
ncbi:unnamed protein product [Microthlaspi erraticum]|uniref:Uncharacterized protein n=1 Tax=Microthlaspi erraticum TaxID=1685480 RepID=A0A6D2IY73_9BRAS|nr:unnamed protein product [Microthlaspi erraticum]